VELAIEIVTSRCQQGHQIGALCIRDFEERRHVSPGNDQCVAGRYRETVANDDRGFVLANDALGG
jgi:hypothetical protein